MSEHEKRFLKEVLEQVHLVNEMFDAIKIMKDYRPEYLMEHMGCILIELENALELDVQCNE